MSHSDINSVIKRRQSVRRFSSRAVQDRTLAELLDLANRAPSSYNLQPWHFVIVRNIDLKQLLRHICMDQEPLTEAPVTVVFVSNSYCWRKPLREITQKSVAEGVMTERHAKEILSEVGRVFSTGPFDILGLYRRIADPLRRIRRPMRNTFASRKDVADYMLSQTMLAISTFLIACETVGLVTSPIDNFDEERLKRLLKIPKNFRVPAVVPVGYPVEGDSIPYSLRFPIQNKISIDLYTSRLKEFKDPDSNI